MQCLLGVVNSKLCECIMCRERHGVMIKADLYGGASLLVIMIDVLTINLSINYMHHDFPD
jgi:hypothetical protein